MNDQPKIAGFNPAQVAALSPESRTNFETGLARAGFSADAIKAALSPAGNTPAPSGNDPSAPTIQRGEAFAPSERDAMVASLRQHWTGDPAALEQGLKAAGVASPSNASDTRTDAERAFDQSALAPGASAHDYHINLAGTGHLAGLSNDQIVKTLSDFGKAFAAAEVPPMIASALAQAMLDTRVQFNAMSPNERSLWNAEQRAALGRLGRDDPDKIIALAKVSFDKMPEAFREELRLSGGMSSARVVHQLALNTQRLQARQALAASRKK